MSIAPDFTPVPRARARHDGWSEARQRDFIAALAEYGMVRAAAEKVGMNAASAYRLRAAAGAESFAAAWDAALRAGMAQLIDIAMDRAINGIAVPRFYKGAHVGDVRWYDNKLLMFMLRHGAPQMFGRHAEEEDAAARADRTAAAAEATRIDQLARAEHMLAQIEADLADIEAAWRDGKRLEERAAHEEKRLRRDRLAAIVEQLRAVDTARAAAASIDQLVAAGRYSARVGAVFKRRLGGPGP